MNAPIQRVSLGFGQGTDAHVEKTAGDVILNLYDNPAFATPPVTKVDLEALAKDFRDAIAATAQGGTAATAEKNNRRLLLVAKLKELAAYVQILSDNDLATLLSSGFHPVSTNRTREALAAPVIERIAHGQSGELLPSVKPVANARGFEAEVAEVTGPSSIGPWERRGFFTGSRRMSVTGLTPGKSYAFRIRAMGGLTGQSDWSAPTTCMCL